VGAGFVDENMPVAIGAPAVNVSAAASRAVATGGISGYIPPKISLP